MSKEQHERTRLVEGLAALRLGHAAQADGRLADAEREYRRAAELRVRDPAPQRYLALVAGLAGNECLAGAAIEAALACNPLDDATHRMAGWIALRQGERDAAERHYARAAALDASNPENWRGLAAAQRQRCDLCAAAAALRLAFDASPASATVALELASVLNEDGRLDDAAIYYRHSLALEPGSVAALAGLGEALHLLGQSDAALPMLAEAAIRDPDDAHVADLLSQCQAALGDREEARAVHEALLKRQPRRADSIAALINLSAGSDNSGLIVEAQNLCDGKSLHHGERARLHHALASWFDARGEHASAFNHFEAYNRLALERSRPARAIDQLVSESISFFDASWFSEAAGLGDPSDRPIFIVGMPRSGTTLVEQILASHPDVHGAGELQYIKQLAAIAARRPGRAGGFPTVIAALSQRDWRMMARFYLQRLEQLEPSARFVTDKMPVNFLYLGLIATLFPNARIIHCRRDPRDVCLSCYFEDFSRGNPEFCTLAGTLASHRHYLRIMSHWRAVLPRPIIEVGYETLVTDFEASVRSLLAACGLPFDEACLSFHRTRRAVSTPSRDAVRAPIHSRSIGRWRNYADFMPELVNAFPAPLV